jgi:hypothetical protein
MDYEVDLDCVCFRLSLSQHQVERSLKMGTEVGAVTLSSEDFVPNAILSNVHETI